MTNKCVHCGISVSLKEQGFLHVHSLKIEEKIWAKGTIISQNNDSFVWEFSNMDDLKQLLKELLTKDNVEVGLGSRQFNASWMVPEALLYMIDNKEYIDFIQHGEMISYLQPIVDLRSMDIMGYESLLRSASTDLNISPGHLFEVAQKSGFHSRLDQRAREAAIVARKNGINEGIKSFINFLPSTIYNPEFCLQHTFKIVEKYNIRPEDLVFEVVETEKIQDVNHLKKIFDRYKQEGIRVALDDVGSGYSTIEMLELLRPDYVKIDRSYISFCDEDLKKQEFLQLAVDHAKRFDIQLLAEGIERKEEWQFCEAAGFDFGQGYLFGKPAPHAQTLIHTIK